MWRCAAVKNLDERDKMSSPSLHRARVPPKPPGQDVGKG